MINKNVQTANSADGRSEKFSIRAYLRALQEKISASPASYLAYCFFVPAIIMYLIYLAMEIHPFGNGSVLVLDLNGQYVYFYEALRNAVYGEGSLLYTFFRGLGGEFMGMYAYYIASPLSYIVALFPQSRILEALLTIILLKVGLCGFSFGFYLHKNTEHPNKVVSVAFAVMYALCAYAVVYQNNIMWIDALIWLPLLTYAIEQMIKNRKYKLFVVSLSLTMMSNYYIGYMVCIYVVLYFFYYYFAHTKEQLNPKGERLHFLRAGARVGVFSLISAAISAFVILGAYYSLTFGKNDFSNPNWSFRQKFDFLDFFTKFLPGSYDTVRPEGLPFVYCGVLALILVPVYFMSKKIRAREKVISLIFIGIFVLSFIASPIDLIWHGFQTPNWLNYRYSFMLSFFLLVLAYKGFGNLRRISERFILGVSAFIILFAAVCEKLEFETYVVSDGELLTLQTVWLTIIAAVAFLVTLCLLIREKRPKARESLAGVLAAFVCVEIFCSSLACVVQFDDDVSYSSYSGYNDFVGGIRPIVEDVKEYDSGFYRMEKLIHRKFNDNMALGIRGLSNSTSTLNAETLKFLNHMGYTSRSHLSQYLGGNPVNDSLLGIKYLIDSRDSDKLDHYYTQILSDEKYSAYQNPYALSVAYGVDESVKNFQMSSYGTHFERLNALVKTMSGTSANIFIPIYDYDTAVSADCAKRDAGSTTTYSVAVEDGTPAVSYSFVAPKSAEYYFYPPARSNAEVKLSVNEENLGKLLGSNTKHIAPLGYFEQGETITVTLTLQGDDVTLYNYYDYFWYINEDAFKNAFEQLRNNPQFLITEYTEDDLVGTITTNKASQMIQTTIPYDEGWKVYLDGEEIETYKTLDALVAFDIENAGEHTLQLKYSPDIYVLGAILSTGGAFVFAVLCVVEFILKKKNKYCPETVDFFWIAEDFDEDHEAMKLLPPEPEQKKKSFSDMLKIFKKKDSSDDQNTPKGED